MFYDLGEKEDSDHFATVNFGCNFRYAGYLSSLSCKLMQMPHSSWSHRRSPIWIHLFRLLDWYPRDLDQERAFDPWILLFLIPHQHNCDRDHGSALPHFSCATLISKRSV